ncbi:ATP-grasp domain-containing protein [Chryseobacterium vaccae]|uniref:ATP-grasp domain-containing protein n=1 Tax=Chryseobacterium vaccae TaxID=2604424 RepID=UPI001294CBA8|nr:ATP-grasp domain-containing protein [Chryseobacterium vaccae]
MIEKAYIHEYGNKKLEPEHQDVIDVLEKRNIGYELFTDKKIFRNQLNIDRTTFVAGNHFVFSSIFKKYKINPPSDCYPQCLHQYLQRNIWTTTIHELSRNIDGELAPVFVKPKSDTKLFTGFRMESVSDFYLLSEFSKNTELYCSQLVDWKAEYRVFVNNSKIVGIQLYNGDDKYKLDMEVIRNAINDLENSKEKTRGYGIDFGILSNGSTALVEWNDGYALGSYGLDKEIYTDLLLERWLEIADAIFPPES